VADVIKRGGRPGGAANVEAAISECAEARERLALQLRRAAALVERSRAGRRRPAGPSRPADALTSAQAAPARSFEAALVQEHLGLARHLAARYQRRGETPEDLEQVAMLALVRAARRYDPSRGVPFSGYATPSILGEIKRHFRDRAWSMRVPRPLQELYLQAKAARDEMAHETGVVPTLPELADRLQCSTEHLLEAMEAGSNFRPASIDGLDEVRSQQLPSAEGGYERVLDHHRLGELLPRLSPAERRILQLRFVDERTQSSIAEELGVSQMHISRTLERILTKLRSGMSSD